MVEGAVSGRPVRVEVLNSSCRVRTDSSFMSAFFRISGYQEHKNDHKKIKIKIKKYSYHYSARRHIVG